MPEAMQRPGFAAAMRLERDHLFDSGHFAKAPTLMRLLAFLVEETLAGRGDQLKSYSVAVDGLGRDADFDTQADSYPRVQVVRLRKLLEAFYARHEPAEHSCIFLKSGSYRVRLAPVAAAYPELVRVNPVAVLAKFPGPEPETDVLPRFSGPIDAVDQAVGGVASPGTADTQARKGLMHGWWLVSVLLLILSLALLAYAFGFRMQQGPSKQIEAPVLLLEPVSAASDPRSAAIADDIYALLADGIGRSWLVRLRLANAPESSTRSATPAYRITAQLGEVSGEGRPVYLRLTEYDSSNLLWTTTINMKAGPVVGDNLGQPIAQLAGPFGVIAARERRIAQDRLDTGYRCLLGYLGNIANDSGKMDSALARCLTQKITDAKLDAVRLAFQSFQALEGYSQGADRDKRMLQAMDLARQSINADPKEAYAHFAMARVQFVTGNCPMGQQHSAHALEANPFDPVMLAVLGNFTAMCGYKEGFAMLDKAYAFRSPGEVHARLSLILAAIWQKQPDRLRILQEDGEEAKGTSAAYHYLCETLIAAALDETAAAKTSWQKFRASSHAISAADDTMLTAIIMSPEIRTKILRFLEEKDVIATPKP